MSSRPANGRLTEETAWIQAAGSTETLYFQQNGLEKPPGSRRFSRRSACPRTPFRWPHPATGNAWIWEIGSAEGQQGAYKSLGLTWGDFCRQHLGLSRSHADQLIRPLDQFGAAYFHLAEIMRISPDSFRRIAPAVHDDCIEIAGELVPITPENALKIKQALLAWQKDSQRARAELAKAQAANASIISLNSRLDACLAEMSAILGGPREAGQDAALGGLLSYSLTKLKRLQRDLDRILA